MHFDLDARTAALSVGEFAAFSLGPRESGDGGSAGIWRAQLGTHWHKELRTRAIAEHGTAAEFELPIAGKIFHRGWTLSLTGRIDQIIRGETGVTLREIKSVTSALPADESELRADYPEYLVQLATYAALWRIGSTDSQIPTSRPEPVEWVSSQLCFVEAHSGLAQALALTPADDALFRAQLERVAEFLSLRLRARERLRGLRFQPAFANPRPGQETTQAELTTLFERRPLVLFEAPTGFGKTGVLLEFALGQLRSGHFDRALYLTSKSTGQLQVMRTLAAMTAEPPTSDLPALNSQVSARDAPAVASWHVRNKSEHCVNHTFHCVRDNCAYLADIPARWAQAGLARFYLDEKHARDLDTLRAAGRDARVCPYEITRTALAFNDVWIGDYNYVFAPRNRGLFFGQPGFVAARTLLLIDEAHNLPARVADAHSHAFDAAAADTVRMELHRVRAPVALVTAWDHWCHYLRNLSATDALSPAAEDDARHLLGEVAQVVRTVPLDLAALGPQAANALWSAPSVLDELNATPALSLPAVSLSNRSNGPLPRLWWCPRDGELALTCLDAAAAIGATLREFGGVVLASATLTPVDGFAVACGLDQGGAGSPSRPDFQRPPANEAANPRRLGEPAPPSSPPEKLGALNKRDTRKLYRQLTSAAELLRAEEARDAASPALLRAHTPWRDGAYEVAFDARVDTSFQQRAQHAATTAATIAALHAAAAVPVAPPLAAGPQSTAHSGRHTDERRPSGSCIAVFFPSYAYAENIQRELASVAPAHGQSSPSGLRIALQPRVRDLAVQSTWVDGSLQLADALFLVLGSSFAESIDALGGRVTHAMVVGPALPEVNAVQRARMTEAALAGHARDAAFRLVYQIPGMTKVNQALGRLVRAPGQHARVILHCRRFLEPTYGSLLASEYRRGTNIHDDTALAAWLAK